MSPMEHTVYRGSDKMYHYFSVSTAPLKAVKSGIYKIPKDRTTIIPNEFTYIPRGNQKAFIQKIVGNEIHIW